MHTPLIPALIVLLIIGLLGTVFLLSEGDGDQLVTIIYIGEKGDFSFLDSSFRGLYRAQDEFGFDIREIQIQKEPDSDPVVDTGGTRSELVLILGGMMGGYAEEVQQRYPDTPIILIDAAEPVHGQNSRSVSFDMSGASYLAGILAAHMTQTRVIGVIGAEDAPVIHSYTGGFVAGVHQDQPDIRVITTYLADDAAGYTMPEEAGVITRRMYDEGADLVFVVAGGSGPGAIRAAEALPGMQIIGVDADQSVLSPDTVVASVVKNLDEIVYREVADVFRGSFSSGAARIGLEEGGTAIIVNPEFSYLKPFIESRYDEAVAMEADNSKNQS